MLRRIGLEESLEPQKLVAVLNLGVMMHFRLDLLGESTNLYTLHNKSYQTDSTQ